jgi:acyl-coenzyme A thioesterase PaaI-like protein
MQQDTHLEVNASLCGRPILLEPEHALVELVTAPEMRADARGLVHGGVVFCLGHKPANLG